MSSIEYLGNNRFGFAVDFVLLCVAFFGGATSAALAPSADLLVGFEIAFVVFRLACFAGVASAGLAPSEASTDGFSSFMIYPKRVKSLRK